MSRMEAERIAYNWNALGNGNHYWAAMRGNDWVLWRRGADGFAGIMMELVA